MWDGGLMWGVEVSEMGWGYGVWGTQRLKKVDFHDTFIQPCVTAFAFSEKRLDFAVGIFRLVILRVCTCINDESFQLFVLLNHFLLEAFKN